MTEEEIKGKKTEEAEKPKEQVEETTVKEVPTGVSFRKAFDKEAWTPKTKIGKMVKAGEIKNIDEILDKGLAILEPEIIDVLLPNLESDLIGIGQSKGKFGGGKRSIWRQVQKKSSEGNKPSFASFAIVGNRDGYIGVGYGKARETVPAREKATRKARLNIIKIRRGSGSWESAKPESNSIPFAVEGKCGSVIVKLMPAPKGTGLIIEKECQKILRLAGIKDIYSKTFGQTKTKLNHIKAFMVAMNKLSQMKVKEEYYKQLGILEGSQGNE